MESRNIVLMNLFAVSNGETDTENRLMDMGERDGEGEMYGESSMETYITICKIDSQWGICCLAQETQAGALYQPRGVGWGGRWEGDSKGRACMYTYG